MGEAAERQPAPALIGLSFAQLRQRLGSATRAKAVLRWLYENGPPPELPERMPKVSRPVWDRVRHSCSSVRHEIISQRNAPDGTVKLALRLDGSAVETVLIPGPRRSTVCVSSQAGCTRRCTFCATASLPFGRNLTAAEILTQYLVARRLAASDQPARNLVFMGMGEPMDNLEPVIEAVDLLSQRPYPALSPAHITVSTAGVIPGMRRFLQRSAAQLALSLNATTDEVRSALMPHNRIWPIRAVLDTVREHLGNRLLFVEYVLFAGINDTIADADRLVELLEGIRARINLIPFNPSGHSSHQAPPEDALRAFRQRIARSGLRCLIRGPRGREIDAACGQLALRAAPSDP